jgi:hypothetical protein
MTKPRKKPMTIAEREAELRATGAYDGYLDQQRKRDLEHERKVEEHARLLAPLLVDLQRCGVPSLAAILVGDGAKAPPYPGALPVLLEHLQRPYGPEQRRFIAAALAVPQARIGWEVLVKAYSDEEDAGVRETLANAIEAAVDESVLDEYVTLVQASEHGSSRVLLLRGLARLGARGIAALRGLRGDPVLRKEVDTILRRIDRKKH